ncbi:MAG: HAD-IA family hydrolase [Acidobacteria bacterium]|nr:HAD-IA family hydrolase [Acidobacteriota bacterium]
MAPLVVFDLDGTIIDSRRDLADSANRLLATYGAPPLAVDAVAGMVGDGARQLVGRVLAAAGVETDLEPALQRFLAIYGDRLIVHTRPYDGIVEVLRALAARSSLALLTNKPEGLSRRILAAFDLASMFPQVVGGDSGFARKPDPAGLRHLIAQHGTAAARTVCVGDSMIDVETARAAGAAVVAARYGFGHLREPLALRAGELEAWSPQDLAPAIDRALRQNPT